MMAWTWGCLLCTYFVYFGCCMSFSVVLLVLENMMVLEGALCGLEMVRNLYPLVVVCSWCLILFLKVIVCRMF